MELDRIYGHSADSKPPEEDGNPEETAIKNKRRHGRTDPRRQTQPKVTPHLEQMLQERKKALQATAAHTDQSPPANSIEQFESSESDASSSANWPSLLHGHPPQVTPQTVLYENDSL